MTSKHKEDNQAYLLSKKSQQKMECKKKSVLDLTKISEKFINNALTSSLRYHFLFSSLQSHFYKELSILPPFLDLPRLQPMPIWLLPPKSIQVTNDLHFTKSNRKF